MQRGLSCTPYDLGLSCQSHCPFDLVPLATDLAVFGSWIYGDVSVYIFLPSHALHTSHPVCAMSGRGGKKKNCLFFYLHLPGNNECKEHRRNQDYGGSQYPPYVSSSPWLLLGWLWHVALRTEASLALRPVVPAGTWCPVSGEHHKTRSPLEESSLACDGLKWIIPHWSKKGPVIPLFFWDVYTWWWKEKIMHLCSTSCLVSYAKECDLKLLLWWYHSFLCEKMWKYEFRCPTYPVSLVVDCWNLLIMSWYPTSVVVEELMIFDFDFDLISFLCAFLAIVCVLCMPDRHRVIFFLTLLYHSQIKHWKSDHLFLPLGTLSYKVSTMI